MKPNSGIPCLVGTQHATTIFKDGDLVEVDAEKGVVRKIDNGDTPTSRIKR